MSKKFLDMSEAFAYCRVKNHPVVVIVRGDRYTLFPSGVAKLLKKGVDS